VRSEDVGIVISTLVADPMNGAAGDLLLAAKTAAEAGIESFTMWPHHVSVPGAPDDGLIDAWTGRLAALETATAFDRGITDRYVAQTAELIDLAARVRAPLVTVTMMRPSIDDELAAIVGLQHVAKVAAECNIKIALEFTPWSGVPDLATAWRLVSVTDEPNLGLVLDAWHWQRQPGGPAHELLESIPGERIFYVQICDVAPEPEADLLHEALNGRLLPGGGVVDFARLGASLEQIGATPYYAAEVYSHELASRGAPEMARLVKESLDRLELVGSAQ
jgi:sugar phosphate isomerase/epimerase